MTACTPTPLVLADALGLSDNEEKILTLCIILLAIMVFVGITAIRRVVETKAREQTKRDLAAFIAEGTMTTEDAMRIIRADLNEPEQKIATGVAWGTIKPEKAEALLRSMRGETAKR
ncbi:MAG TPA: hypothetical protein VK176_02340 [Phycisphaerales bacterium]|nr:hypothetical protein [Phycisphaerales bacterium]